jgi:4-hydroxybenzoate polyprenyltransferase
LLRSAALIGVSLRPGQWGKNLFVLGPLVFSENVGNPALLGSALAAFVCFCVLSSAIYLMNDLVDRHRDAFHPEKRNRPIASGALPAVSAGVSAVVLIGCCLGVAGFLGATFLGVTCLYLVLMLAYCLVLKNVVIADVGSIAAGFLLRTFAGGAAIEVRLSEWLLICTALLSLFLALGKRRYELNKLGEQAIRHRPVLAQYTNPLLDQLISITATACLVSYLLYCVMSPTAAKHSGLLLTAPFVAYGLFRYLYQIYRHEKGGSPESLLLSDKSFLANGCCYVGSVFLVMYLT